MGHEKDLPSEVLKEVLQRVTVRDLGRCKRVCSTWKNLVGKDSYRFTKLIADEKIWRTVILQEFPGEFDFMKNTSPIEFAKQLFGVSENLKKM